ncbi:hypothetical protein AVEN_179116-1 [Araneus ventricosus]|uniref:Histone-lysine N-methyltransferase SETMAR n=1 Tax=Araneus ventricosus TaxID=182803 RepID=A0A4Y2F3L0_ARAVE|nr:hypothetical protein AVEN_179116-1 [Araneus ventricosus]
MQGSNYNGEVLEDVLHLGYLIEWPAFSPNLSFLDFSLRCHMKTLTYNENPVDSSEDFSARISEAAVAIDVFDILWQSIQCLRKVFIGVGDFNFEQFL